MAPDHSPELRAVMVARGLTTAQVATWLGVAPRTVQAWLNAGRWHRRMGEPAWRVLCMCCPEAR